MKTYSGNELIKVAKYRQAANKFLTNIESRGFSIEKVTVDKNIATFFYKGEQDGKTITLDIYVKANKHEIGLTAKCGDLSLKCDFECYSYIDRPKFEKWLGSVTKLDTKEALDGTLPMTIDLWLTIPRHNEFYQRIRKDIRPLLYFDSWIENKDWYIEMPGDYKLDGVSSFPLPQLVYSSKINDFVLDPDHSEVNFGFGFTSRHTAFIHYRWYEFDKRGNQIIRKMFPEAKQLPKKPHEGRDEGHFRFDTDYETVINIVKTARERLLAVYDEEAKKHGLPDTWKTATEWTTDGPIYPKGTDAANSIDKLRDEARAEIIEKNLSVIKEQVSRRSDVPLEELFPGAHYLDKVPKWREDSILHGSQYDFEAYAIIPYKFPKIKGSKIAWQDKAIEITLNYEKTSDRFTVSYRIPFKFACMCGVYKWFYEAKKHDTEKMMIIKNSGRAIYTDIGYSGFKHIKQHLDELKQFAEYKGFKD